MQQNPQRQPRRVLVLQGGGALGAYQAGVYEGLNEAEFRPNWIAGTSIGAINAAIIAGNSRETRVDRLRAFWETASSSLPLHFAPPDARTRSFVNEASALWIATAGVSGFFRPRIPPALFYPSGAPQARSLYDTSPLRETLEKLVDFDRINAREIRLSLGAVNVQTGELVYFDNERHTLGPDHVMASGALPPGFPPVEIDGQYFWDGGVVSNTPLQYVLDEDTEDDLLVFQVDLFSPHGELPNTVLEAIEREKDIRYSSRTRRNTEAILQKHDAKMAIRSLLNALPPELASTEVAGRVCALARENAVTVVQLVYRDKPYESSSKDFEFSRQSMLEHWSTGHQDICRTMTRRESMVCDRKKGATTLIDVVESIDIETSSPARD
jgi:NTE family protein